MLRNQVRAHWTAIALCGLFAVDVQAATLTVLNSNDSGPGSLRQAVADAVASDVIVFDAATNGSMITLTTGEIPITVGLTITGNDTTNTVISGGGVSRVFNIMNAGNVSIDGVKLTMGSSATDGRAMSISNSTVSMTGSAVTQSAAGLRRGGIYIGSGSLTLAGAWVRANTAAGRWRRKVAVVSTTMGARSPSVPLRRCSAMRPLGRQAAVATSSTTRQVRSRFPPAPSAAIARCVPVAASSRTPRVPAPRLPMFRSTTTAQVPTPAMAVACTSQARAAP